MSAQTTRRERTDAGSARLELAQSEQAQSGQVRPDQAPGALRILALTAVGVGLAALAAATFVLSYPGIHVLALQAGVAPRLARGYPLLIDAMLVIVLAAVLALRGADLPSKLLAWTTLLAVLAAAAAADALHAAGRRLPDHVAAVTAAVLPWVLVFLAFALLLTMLRHVRMRGARRLAAARSRAAGRGMQQAAAEPDLSLAYSSAQPELAVDADPAPDDPSSDEAVLDSADQDSEQDAAEQDEAEDPQMPVFHRMWSAPTPPEP
jgi:hypothetical protein